jgi:hypothetical protein
MTHLKRWMRRRLEKWLGEYHDGPEPPERIRQMAISFANEHPHATRSEWVEFAAGHAEESHRRAFILGVEHVERDPEWRPDVPPELIADAIDPDWRDSAPVNLLDPDGDIPAAYTEEERIRDHLDGANLLRFARRG